MRPRGWLGMSWLLLFSACSGARTEGVGRNIGTGKPDAAVQEQTDAGSDVDSVEEMDAEPEAAAEAEAAVVVQPEETGLADSGTDAAEAAAPRPCDGGLSCGGACCRADEVCADDSVCTPQQAACQNNDSCQHDSYCRDGRCVPYALASAASHDVSCQTTSSLAEVAPVVQCRWQGPEASDPHPEHKHVIVTTMVADFDADADPNTLSPSIVFVSYPYGGTGYQQPGVLRVISGKDCSLQWSLHAPEDAVTTVSPVAIADLTADGRPEIVALAQGGGLLAFRLNLATQQFERLWRSGTCSGTTRTPDYVGPDLWSGPAIHDLDDDGTPEIIYGATVYDAQGCMRSALEMPAYSFGVVPVLANLDDDPRIELVQGNSLREWDANAKAWVPDPIYTAPGNTLGQVAVAELGSFPIAAQGERDFAEVAVVSSGTVRVQTLSGAIVFGPYAIPGGGTGGPPTIADFDGDGRREIGVAGGLAYVVFDLDCVQGGNAAGCGGTARSDGVLWKQTTQDLSSNVTGSSVFDFDADGHAEVAYADECFFRIYDGATGAVAASLSNTSLTAYEYPVIADVDGDFHSEVVIVSNGLGGYASCPASDPLFPSAVSSTGQGITVLRQKDDRWAASRPIWNQHAYTVTNVDDHGVVPTSSAVAPNFRDPKLNNFRQNTQGGLSALGIADLTVRGSAGSCTAEGAALRATVCNRGTLPAPAGQSVAFYLGVSELCRAQTSAALLVGSCGQVACNSDALDPNSASVKAVADPDGTFRECHELNNGARSWLDACR